MEKNRNGRAKIATITVEFRVKIIKFKSHCRRTRPSRSVLLTRSISRLAVTLVNKTEKQT